MNLQDSFLLFLPQAREFSSSVMQSEIGKANLFQLAEIKY